jgi:hypothetical protein
MGTQLAGWLDVARPAARVRDPVYARIAVLESGERRVGLVSLDLLSVRGSDVADVRRRVEAAAGLPADSLLIAATHNHAGPAIVSIGPFRRDDAYLEWLKQALVRLAEEALAALEPAEVGVGVGFEGRLSFNRRWVMKNGLVRTQPGVANPQVLYCEGPIDPQSVFPDRSRPGYLLPFQRSELALIVFPGPQTRDKAYTDSFIHGWLTDSGRLAPPPLLTIEECSHM